MSILGFYCNNTIPVIQELEETYGSKLEDLTYSEKLWLVMVLAEDATYEAGDNYKTIRPKVGELRQKFLMGTDPGDKIKLAIAILENTEPPPQTDFLSTTKVIDWFKDIHCEELKERAQDTINMNWLEKPEDIGKDNWEDFNSSPQLLKEFPSPYIDSNSIDWGRVGRTLIDYYHLKIWNLEK